jgi:hypothetical protein
MGRFYGTNPTIGMHAKGASDTGVSPMVASVLSRRTPDGKPAYSRNVAKLNDTADPVALIRNALTAQPDQTATVVLAGPPTNLLGMLALPEGKKLVQKKVRAFILAGPFGDREGIARLLELWPGSAIFVSEDIGKTLRFPASSIDEDFAWASTHPVVDAFRSTNTPADVPVLAGGQLQFTAAQGLHRQLMTDAAQSERIVQAWRQIVSAKPPEPRRGGRGPQP